MSLSAEYLQFSQQIIANHDIPEVASIHLPILINEPKKNDEFGFVFLADGTAAPFYTSLEDTLTELWTHFSPEKFKPTPIPTILDWLISDKLERRAIAFGAYNAMSQHLLAKSNLFDKNQATNMKQHDIMQSSGRVGMVGYFRPLVEQLLNQDKPVLLVEKNPDRVELQDGLTLASGPEDLNHCDDILCTASTLFNNSLEEILQYKRKDAYFALIGPSASGLPDILFKHGIDEVGGIRITDESALRSALSKQASWGFAGEKYRLYRSSYPGIDKLL